MDHKFASKLDKMDESLSKIELEVTEIKTEFKGLNEDVKELKGATKAQIWTLIGILITAVSGFILAVGRFVFYTNP